MQPSSPALSRLKAGLSPGRLSMLGRVLRVLLLLARCFEGARTIDLFAISVIKGDANLGALL